MGKQYRRTSSAYNTCSTANESAADGSDSCSDTFLASQWNTSSILQPTLTNGSMNTIGDAEYDDFASFGGSLARSCSAHPFQDHGQPSSSTNLSNPRSAITLMSKLSLQHPILSQSSSPGLMHQQYSHHVADSHCASTSLAHTPYAADTISASYMSNPGPPSAPHPVSGYTSDSSLAPWSRTDHYTSDVERYATGGLPSPAPVSLPPYERNTSPSDESQKRPPRKLTTREEANYRCDVKGCGKFFSRSYNFKAHMETHCEKREYPFPCEVSDCTKKFVRKTDLQRHHQSVHMKERNHGCDYCGRMFARRDTLKRHKTDGCHKRFDIGTMDLRTETHGEGSFLMAPSLPPLAMPPNGFRSTSGAFFHKHTENEVDASWAEE
ncbi:hypothetical protein BD289DRAFT_375848 [Coniella lustricola]|uniref:C2H2-type domain-containing protein n=1 Tax=Coniella lustricola TaxID=2025994 RepID=A0A2T2ZXQ7_9PEZI|nr:hypothetical protein BD289DRAFT_375848 [Coniella lustricola]